jgi:hypothetical protein
MLARTAIGEQQSSAVWLEWSLISWLQLRLFFRLLHTQTQHPSADYSLIPK